MFMWEPAPGFLGPFDLVFVRSNGGDVVRVRVSVRSKADRNPPFALR
jgi:hypothetical protein